MIKQGSHLSKVLKPEVLAKINKGFSRRLKIKVSTTTLRRIKN